MMDEKEKCWCNDTGISFLPGKGVEAHDHHAEDKTLMYLSPKLHPDFCS